MRPEQSSFIIRTAHLDDLNSLIELRRSMYEAMFVPAEALDEPTWQDAFTNWFSGRVDDPSTRIVVAETSGGTVAACAIGEVTALIPGPQFPTGRVGLLSNVSTLADYRGEGMGAACTDAVLDWFTEAKVERIDLFATDAGEPIYLNRGFERRRFPAMVRREAF